jgi:UDP-N-acetylglucosamine diphosphorylase/glucosamine-1-phosphate N-acetyltransferase
MSNFQEIVFFDDEQVKHLKPFVLTRPAALIRCGILTLAEKWSLHCNIETHSFITQTYLQVKYPFSSSDKSKLFVNSRLFPNQNLLNEINALTDHQALIKEGTLLAFVSNKYNDNFENTIESSSDVLFLNRIHNIFTLNPNQIEEDFYWMTKGRTSAKLNESNRVFGKHPIFVEEGVVAESAVFNTNEGPIYLGKDSEVMEGSLIRGPFALCEHAVVKMAAKIYSGTTIGPYSKVGGEISNSVLFAYSNKGHDGFLGNSVLGEWCNLGADTNNSNLKNNYEVVKLWNYSTNNFEKTGLQFCGLFMGDHSKCGINTMFNTGTVVGVSANLFGSGFPRNFVPSFSWGGASGFETYLPKKAFQTAEIVMKRRDIALSDAEKDILNYIFEEEQSYRNWEKQ